jgi:hypothetical protein
LKTKVQISIFDFGSAAIICKAIKHQHTIRSTTFFSNPKPWMCEVKSQHPCR